MSDEKARLIEAARLVAADPSDGNVTELLRAVMDLPYSDMPREYLDSPLTQEQTTGSAGWMLRNIEAIAGR